MASRGLSRDATSVVLSEDVVTQARPGKAPRCGLVLASHLDERDPEEMSDSGDDENSALGEGCVHVEWLSSDEDEAAEEAGRHRWPSAGLPVGRASRQRASDDAEMQPFDEVVDTTETPLTVVDRGSLSACLPRCFCQPVRPPLTLSLRSADARRVRAPRKRHAGPGGRD